MQTYSRIYTQVIYIKASLLPNKIGRIPTQRWEKRVGEKNMFLGKRNLLWRNMERTSVMCKHALLLGLRACMNACWWKHVYI